MPNKTAPFTRGIPQDNWRSSYNAFNSFKYLMWRDHIEAILQGNFKPPYMVDLDPSNICNYDNCIWCNSRTFRHEKPMMIPEEHLIKLADFLGKWGVKSCCVSGGGESMTNPGFSKLLYRLQKNNIKNGVITNASLIDSDKAKAIVDTSSWCGISIDAASPETFSAVHGVKPEMFNKVINNVKKLAMMKKKYNSSVEITFKFLLHPLNAYEILDAVRLAKKIGCNTFHLRPVCVDNLYGQNQKQIVYPKHLIDIINIQMMQAQHLETDDFRFFGVRHKFNPDFTRKVNFKKCLATPLMTTFCADGTISLCFDVRGKWTLCNHYPNPEKILSVWGSEKHKKMIENIDSNQCPRCTLSTLNEIIEQVFIEDKMFRDFL